MSGRTAASIALLSAAVAGFNFQTGEGPFNRAIQTDAVDPATVIKDLTIESLVGTELYTDTDNRVFTFHPWSKPDKWRNTGIQCERGLRWTDSSHAFCPSIPAYFEWDGNSETLTRQDEGGNQQRGWKMDESNQGRYHISQNWHWIKDHSIDDSGEWSLMSNNLTLQKTIKEETTVPFVKVFADTHSDWIVGISDDKLDDQFQHTPHIFDVQTEMLIKTVDTPPNQAYHAASVSGEKKVLMLAQSDPEMVHFYDIKDGTKINSQDVTQRSEGFQSCWIGYGTLVVSGSNGTDTLITILNVREPSKSFSVHMDHPIAQIDCYGGLSLAGFLTRDVRGRVLKWLLVREDQNSPVPMRQHEEEDAQEERDNPNGSVDVRVWRVIYFIAAFILTLI